MSVVETMSLGFRIGLFKKQKNIISIISMFTIILLNIYFTSIWHLYPSIYMFIIYLFSISLSSIHNHNHHQFIIVIITINHHPFRSHLAQDCGDQICLSLALVCGDGVVAGHEGRARPRRSREAQCLWD